MGLALHKRKHIATWRESGLSQRAYCREHGLNAKTFGNWLRIDRQTKTEIPSLIPVKLKPAASSEQLLYLRGSGAYTLQLPVDISPQWLGALDGYEVSATTGGGGACNCSSLARRRLTIPSSGCPAGCAVRPPLMSNVRIGKI